MDQAESVAEIRAHLRSERRLFEAVGALAASTDDPAAKVLLDELARHHGWRASQWEALDPGPGAAPEVEDPADDVSGSGLDGSTAELPAGASGLVAWLDRVLPSSRAGYLATRDGAGTVAGGPARRAAERCLADLDLDRRDVEAAIERTGGATGAVGG